MPYETLRFLHAARALVDHPLHETGPVGVDLRGIVCGATTNAFRKVIVECLEHDVDFLLMTGDALDQSDFSIKARVELRDGFEQLDDAGIQVFVVPGPRDPLSVWDDFPEMPSNVTVFRPETDDPVAVLRDGAVIASIRAMAWRNSWFGSEQDSSHRTDRSLRGTRASRTHDDELPHADLSQRRAKEADEAETWDDTIDAPYESFVNANDDPELDEADHDIQLDATLSNKHEAHREIRRVQSAADLRPNHFAIAIVRDGVDHPGSDPQADYLAVVGGLERTTSKGADWLMHFPGGTQGLSPEEAGLHGCSLVDLDSDGVIRCRFLPTAPVRWENFQIDIDADTTFDQLVRRMQAACRELCGVPESPPKPQVKSLVAEYGDAADDDIEDSENSNDSATTDEGQLTIPSDQLHAQACFLRWTIRGDGTLFNSLSAEATQAELADWLDAASDWPLEVARLHRFRLLATEPVAARSTADDDNDQLDVPIEYFWRVDQAEPLGRSAWNDLGEEGAEQRERFARITAAAPRCDAEVVFSQARRRGWKWFKAGQAK